MLMVLHSLVAVAAGVVMEILVAEWVARVAVKAVTIQPEPVRMVLLVVMRHPVLVAVAVAVVTANLVVMVPMVV